MAGLDPANQTFLANSGFVLGLDGRVIPGFNPETAMERKLKLV